MPTRAGFLAEDILGERDNGTALVIVARLSDHSLISGHRCPQKHRPWSRSKRVLQVLFSIPAIYSLERHSRAKFEWV